MNLNRDIKIIRLLIEEYSGIEGYNTSRLISHLGESLRILYNIKEGEDEKEKNIKS